MDLDKYTMRINEVVTVKPKTPQQQRVAAFGIKKTLLHVHSKQNRHGKRTNAYSSSNKSCSSS